MHRQHSQRSAFALAARAAAGPRRHGSARAGRKRRSARAQAAALIPAGRSDAPADARRLGARARGDRGRGGGAGRSDRGRRVGGSRDCEDAEAPGCGCGDPSWSGGKSYAGRWDRWSPQRWCGGYLRGAGCPRRHSDPGQIRIGPGAALEHLLRRKAEPDVELDILLLARRRPGSDPSVIRFTAGTDAGLHILVGLNVLGSRELGDGEHASRPGLRIG